MKKEWSNLVSSFSGKVGVLVGSNQIIHLSHNPDEIFPAASMIKLFILWEFFRQVEENKLDPNQKISLTNCKKVFGCGVIDHLNTSASLTLGDLATLMIIVSDNSATNFLIDLLGFENINQTCQKEGWGNTKLQRKMMDIIAQTEGKENLTTPQDTYSLFSKLIAPKASLTCESRKRFIEILKAQQFNHKLSTSWNGKIEFAHKTGELSTVDHDAGILYTQIGEVIAVCFTKDFLDLKESLDLQNQLGKLVYQSFAK